MKPLTHKDQFTWCPFMYVWRGYQGVKRDEDSSHCQAFNKNQVILVTTLSPFR